jgi:NAD(P)-dependent dehydrogenase (short-subunit alcohol dehydrogenase family)
MIPPLSEGMMFKMKRIAQEMEPFGIRVNAMAPEAIRTPIQYTDSHAI